MSRTVWFPAVLSITHLSSFMVKLDVGWLLFLADKVLFVLSARHESAQSKSASSYQHTCLVSRLCPSILWCPALLF